MNQNIIKKIQTLISENHTQIFEEFTSVSTLIQELKESLGIQISNSFEAHMNHNENQNDHSLQNQFIIEIKNSNDNFQKNINQTMEKLLHKAYSDTKSDFQQILIKLNNDTLKVSMKKKLRKIEQKLENAEEAYKNTNVMIEHCTNEIKAEINNSTIPMANHITEELKKQLKEDLNHKQEGIDKLTEGSLITINNIGVADRRNEERTNGIMSSIEENLNKWTETLK
jgi:predicted S18 family serine protease